MKRQFKGQGTVHDIQVRLLDGDNGPGDDDLVVAPLLEEPAVEGEVFSLIGKSDVVDPKEAAVEEQAGVALHDEVLLKNLYGKYISCLLMSSGIK